MFEQFKTLADRKKEVFDEDLEAIVKEMLEEAVNGRRWELVGFQTTRGRAWCPRPRCGCEPGYRRDRHRRGHRRRPDRRGLLLHAADDGTGGRAQRVRAADMTGGRDAQGEVNLELLSGGKSFRGRGRSTDVIEASVLAYLNSLNRLTRVAGEREEAGTV